MFNIPKHCLAIVTKTSHPPPNEKGLACVELHGPESYRQTPEQMIEKPKQPHMRVRVL